MSKITPAANSKVTKSNQPNQQNRFQTFKWYFINLFWINGEKERERDTYSVSETFHTKSDIL